MNQRLLTSAIMLALGGSSSQLAMAAIDLDNPANSTPIILAKELQSSPVIKNTTTGALNVQVALGFGFVQGNSDIYARFDLEGAEFRSPLFGSNLLGQYVDSNNSAVISDKDYVVFNVATSNAVDTSQMTLQIPDLQVTSTFSQATIQYRLFTEPSEAFNGTGTVLKNVTGTIIKFESGVSIEISKDVTATASLDSSFEEFEITNVTSTVTARLGAFSIADAPNVFGVTSTGNVYLLSDSNDPNNPDGNRNLVTVLDDATTVTIAGDFSMAAANGVYFTSDVNCGTGAGHTVVESNIAADDTSAVFDIGSNTTPNNGGGLFYFCYRVEGIGGRAIRESDYRFTLIPEGNIREGYSSDIALSTNLYTDRPIGNIKRAGASLLAGFTSLSNPQVSRFIFINTSSADVDITAINVFTNEGVSYNQGTEMWGLPITIPAEKRKAIQMKNVIRDFSQGQAAGVEFIISGSCSQVSGLYQYLIKGSEVPLVMWMKCSD
jgi:hypothetical protein